MKRFLVFTLFMLLVFPAFAKSPIRTMDGVVAKVSDGDTIAMDANGTNLKVRLYGIDAPETSKPGKPGQPYGEEAQKILVGKLLGRRVRVDIIDIDRYKRSVSIVWLGNRDINREMVSEGWAWAYKEYLHGPYASEYIKAEDEARSQKLGLWQQSNPQPPWEFRKQLKVR